MIVVDTNILVYHWLPGSRGAETDALMQLDPAWAAPVLWRSEFRNVVTGYLRHRRFDLPEAKRSITNAADCLLGGEHSVADELVLALITRSKCSSYDCEFVALAETLDALLITEDQALLKNFPGHCLSLSEAIRTGLRR